MRVRSSNYRSKNNGSGLERKPAYLAIPENEFLKRVDMLKKMMKSCTICPRNCRVDRLTGIKGQCGAAGEIIISSIGPHFGEEKELVGSGGSGTIFFTNCNLECVYCQNWTISRGEERGALFSEDELAEAMLSLQKRGCSNINLVSPTPYLYGIVMSLFEATKKGLSIPLVYNCGGYESLNSLKLLEGLVDIYMPDAKYASDEEGRLYSGIDDYFTRLREALKEMQRQVGDLETGIDGLAYKGLLIRHLVLPGNVAGSEKMARFLKDEISPNCAVNVMAQYYPAYLAGQYPVLNRRITSSEYSKARKAFTEKGLRLL